VLLGGVPRPARSCKCCRLWLVPLLSPARKPQLASLLSATTAKGPVITLHLVPFPTFNHPLPITSPEDGEQTLHWHLSACWVPLWTLPSLHRALPRCQSQNSLPRSSLPLPSNLCRKHLLPTAGSRRNTWACPKILPLPRIPRCCRGALSLDSLDPRLLGSRLDGPLN